MLVSSRQITAARGLLGWSRTELADRALLSLTTVADVERGDVDPKHTTISKIIETLEAAGIEFVRGDLDGRGEGVRILKNRPKSEKG
jgi:predicted transcriptional regulator